MPGRGRRTVLAGGAAIGLLFVIILGGLAGGFASPSVAQPSAPGVIPDISGASGGAQAALSWALSHVGVFGYSQGPTTDRGGSVADMQSREPAGTTCDCSMFVRWAMAQAGIDVGSTTAQQWPANGLLPDDETAQDAPTVSRGVGPNPPPGGYLPGDMIFWGHGAGDAGHVALYAGNGIIVHCSGRAGSNTSPLNGYGPPTGWLRWHAVVGS